MNTIRALVLLGATLSTGLITGTFALYAHTIMPALRHTDDRTFVGAFQSLDRAIVNPWFMVTGFAGALVLTVAATLTSLGTSQEPWVAAALGLYLVAVVVTLAVNVPRNDAIKAAGAPDCVGDLRAVRVAFGEARWAAWNLVRVASAGGAFAALAWALVIYGRATP